MARVPSSFAVLVVAAFAATALAGCLGGGEAGDDGAPDPGQAKKPTTSEVTVEPPAEAAGAVGDLEVRLKGDGGAPLAGATVTVVPSAPNGTLDVPPALTSDAGIALFKGLPAQAYRVEAQADGYETAVQGATVLASQLAKVEMRLKEIIAARAYNVTVEFAGRVLCTAGAGFLLKCELVSDQTAAAGLEQNAIFTWAYGNAADPPVPDKVFEVWVEATWQVPGQLDAIDNGKLVLFDPSSPTANAISETNRQPIEDPPARVVASAQLLQGWGLDKGGNLSFELQPANRFDSPGVALDWKFTAWATVFYNAPADPCWSPARGKLVLTDGCKAAREEMQP